MPNWCFNEVHFKGEPDQISELRDLLANPAEGRVFDFDKLIPQPDDVKNATGENMDWYTWRTNNWGTKWNLDGETEFVDSGDELVYIFYTAWGPPEGIFLNITERFPDVDIFWRFEEPGNGVYGSFTQQLAEEWNRQARLMNEMLDANGLLPGSMGDEDEEPALEPAAEPEPEPAPMDEETRSRLKSSGGIVSLDDDKQSGE